MFVMAEEIYTVAVKKRFRVADGDVLRWVERPVSDVIPEKDSLEYPLQRLPRQG
jgi:hypothetical protein